MFDSKMLLVILAIALVIFGTKRLRSIGTDLGAADIRGSRHRRRIHRRGRQDRDSRQSHREGQHPAGPEAGSG